MANILNYIKKYKDVSFDEMSFNDVDAVILSQIPYYDFSGIVDDEKISLSNALELFLKRIDKKSFYKNGFIQKNLCEMAPLLIKSKRFGNLDISHYVYKITSDEQFCAICIYLSEKTKYIAYEGTDSNLVGWKEDLSCSYVYPCPAQKDASKYLKNVVSLFDKNIIIGGHSKGGNLALVAAMRANILIKSKIRKIYCVDGTGLLKKQVDSLKYNLIKHKIVDILPSNSVVGLLLLKKHKFQVIKSTRFDLYAHSVFTWRVKDNKFEKGSLSKFSQNLSKKIYNFIKIHTVEQRRENIEKVFMILEEMNITNILDAIKIKNIIILTRRLQKSDVSTRELLGAFISILKIKDEDSLNDK